MCWSVTALKVLWTVKLHSPLPDHIRIYTTISYTFSIFSFPWCSVFIIFHSSRSLLAHFQSPCRSLIISLLCTVVCTKQILWEAVTNGCSSSSAWRAAYSALQWIVGLWHTRVRRYPGAQTVFWTWTKGNIAKQQEVIQGRRERQAPVSSLSVLSLSDL